MYTHIFNLFSFFTSVFAQIRNCFLLFNIFDTKYKRTTQQGAAVGGQRNNKVKHSYVMYFAGLLALTLAAKAKTIGPPPGSTKAIFAYCKINPKMDRKLHMRFSNIAFYLLDLLLQLSAYSPLDFDGHVKGLNDL